MQENPERELTIERLDELASEVRSERGPAETTKAFNATMIATFRANAGKVPGDLARGRFLLLTTTGAKSGRERTTPLSYFRIDERILVIASKGGAPTDPAWYRNLLAHPEVTVEIGDEAYKARAVPTEGEDRDRLFARAAAKIPTFADYQERTTRTIPVVELKRLH